MRIDLASTRLAFVLIALLVAHIALSAVIPQEGFAENQIVDWQHQLGGAYRIIEFLRLDSIYTAWPFHILLLLLALNLAIGNIQRFRQVYRVERTLLRARYLGSIIFHLGLLVILAGAVLNYLYKFQGVLALTEGQSVQDAPAGYFRLFEGPLRRADFGRFEFKIDSVDPEFEVGDTTTVAAEASLVPADGSTAIHGPIRVNGPLLWNGMEFHLGRLVGYSPEIQIVDGSDQIIFRSFVRLAVSTDPMGDHHADFLELPDDSRLHLEVRADAEQPRVITYLERDGRDSEQAEIALAGSGEVDEMTIGFPRLRRWVFIEVRRNPYLGLVFVGFWSALAGLTVTLIPRVFGGRRESRA